MFTLNIKRSLRPLWIVDTRLPWKDASATGSKTLDPCTLLMINKCFQDMEKWIFFSFLECRLIFFICAWSSTFF